MVIYYYLSIFLEYDMSFEPLMTTALRINQTQPECAQRAGTEVVRSDGD